MTDENDEAHRLDDLIGAPRRTPEQIAADKKLTAKVRAMFTSKEYQDAQKANIRRNRMSMHRARHRPLKAARKALPKKILNSALDEAWAQRSCGQIPTTG